MDVWQTSLQPMKKTIVLLLLIFLTACDNSANNTPVSDRVSNEPATNEAVPDESVVNEPAPDNPTTSDESATEPEPSPQLVDFEDVKSGSVALTESGAIYVVLGRNERVGVRYSLDDGETFSELVQVNTQASSAYLSSFEHPSITASDDGQVNVTWGQLAGGAIGSVWYANSTDGGETFGEPAMLMEPLLRTFAQRMSADSEQNPVVAWLEDGRLRLSRSLDAGATFVHEGVVDTEVCDCCAPEPLVTQEGVVYVAYRNLERDESGRAIRDIYVARSNDNGATFAPEVRVSDAPWFIESCPVNGPSLAIQDELMVLAWIDGRNDVERTLAQTDLFVATSSDGGATFSPNVQVNGESGDYYSTPAIALGEDGRIHLSWSVFALQEQALFYAVSEDGGQTFSEPILLASSADDSGRGRPETQKMVVDGSGRVYLMWADLLGVHLAIIE